MHGRHCCLKPDSKPTLGSIASMPRLAPTKIGFSVFGVVHEGALWGSQWLLIGLFCEKPGFSSFFATTAEVFDAAEFLVLANWFVLEQSNRFCHFTSNWQIWFGVFCSGVLLGNLKRMLIKFWCSEMLWVTQRQTLSARLCRDNTYFYLEEPLNNENFTLKIGLNEQAHLPSLRPFLAYNFLIFLTFRIFNILLPENK